MTTAASALSTLPVLLLLLLDKTEARAGEDVLELERCELGPVSGV